MKCAGKKCVWKGGKEAGWITHQCEEKVAYIPSMCSVCKRKMVPIAVTPAPRLCKKFQVGTLPIGIAFMINLNKTANDEVCTSDTSATLIAKMFHDLKAKIVITKDFKKEFGNKLNEIIGKDYITELKKACGYKIPTGLWSWIKSWFHEPWTVVEVTNKAPTPGDNQWIFNWTVPAER